VSNDPIVSPAAVGGRMPPFRVEVSGTWQDARLGTRQPWTQVFLVAAPGPRAAEMAGAQLFGGAAARMRCLALPGCSARVLADSAVDLRGVPGID
jgi:hypothetical protein